MGRVLPMTMALGLCAGAPAALAQPADMPVQAATTDRYPPGVHVAQAKGGAVYVDAGGHVLYGLDMRVLLRAGPDPSHYCTGACLNDWQPLLAPPGTTPTASYPRRFGPPSGQQRAAPDWAVIDGPQGPQWVYKGWHMVFVRRGDRPGSTAFDGAGDFTWNTLKYLAPKPQVTAPNDIQAVVQGGAYALADAKGHLLYTGACANPCAAWHPLPAGMASAPVGDWTVDLAGDAPQWKWRGRLVYVSLDDDDPAIPAGGAILRP
jgi:predicted lipoprotein with Yx(FWY)xxD motif